jgi:hypothetical protein
MEDREVREYGLVSRQIRRAITADGEPGGENMGEIDAHAGSRQNLAHAPQDMTMILCDLTRALPNHPNTRDTHRIGRKRDEPFLLGRCPQAKHCQGAFASGSVKKNEQGQCTGFVAPRQVVDSLSAVACRGLHGARLARPACFLGGCAATLHQQEKTKQQNGDTRVSQSRLIYAGFERPPRN